MTQQISIVAPIFNEVGNLKALCDSVGEALVDFDYELLLINDGSDDGSTELLNDLAAANDRVKVIHFVRNYGQTAALKAGFKHASYELIVTIDGDMQNDPSDIPAMVKKLDEGWDVVTGWRKNRKDTFVTRTLPSKIANRLISRLSNVHLHDYGCTLRVYKAEFVRDVPLYGEMHRFLPIYVTWAGAKLVEVPVKHHPRTSGESKYGLSRIPKVLLDLTTLKFLRDYYVTPIYFFGALGVASIVLGVGAGLLSLLCFQAWASPTAGAVMAVIGPMLILFGIVEITLGVIAEVMIRMHYDIRDKEPFKIRLTQNMDD
ncbi:MAG: glycosyltransferase family 2 protein [Gammaproteobacteria bacterium]|nr:glycosyltransferase family 2 protein [Gammaproteobacteria bacterium]